MTKACDNPCVATNNCWACGTSVHTTSCTFKCGSCGALTDSGVSGKAGSTKHRRLTQAGQQLFVAIVAALISADALISILWLLPVTHSGISLRLQQFAGVYAAANVISRFLGTLTNMLPSECLVVQCCQGSTTTSRGVSNASLQNLPKPITAGSVANASWTWTTTAFSSTTV